MTGESHERAEASAEDEVARGEAQAGGQDAVVSGGGPSLCR